VIKAAFGGCSPEDGLLAAFGGYWPCGLLALRAAGSLRSLQV